MGALSFWIWSAVAFGVMSGSLYTWLASNSTRKIRLWVRATLIYTALALGAVWLAYQIA